MSRPLYHIDTAGVSYYVGITTIAQEYRISVMLGHAMTVPFKNVFPLLNIGLLC
jgi:hypothetical protein